jgi:hypothetical protein
MIFNEQKNKDILKYVRMRLKPDSVLIRRERERELSSSAKTIGKEIEGDV